MTPERWQQIDKIFQAAIELDPRQRAAFLNSSCGDDEELRREVESLIFSDEEGSSLIDAPAFETAAGLFASDSPELKQGQRLGRYQIISLLGRGGMGEVYLAEDSELGRKIAIKVLPAEFTRNKERLRRFRQEARAASALNHPNILTIHEISQVEDRHLMATEFVEGETFRQRLKRAPITISEALPIAIQVASALSAAHKAGIVHRDIKPENIMLRPDGYVKVLDFGLAKLTEQDEATPHARAADQLDISSGLVMGTVKYMSPEQARAQRVDPRSDIFSFGVVLYEMLAGRAPFEGETASELVAAILKKEPRPLTSAPDDVQRLVMRALRKRREERYQKIEDLLVDLKSLKEDTRVETQTLAQGTHGSVLVTSEAKAISTAPTLDYVVSGIKEHRIGAALAMVALLISGAAMVYVSYKFIRQPKSTAPSPNAKLTRITTSDKAQYSAISPDGRYVAYVPFDNGQQTLRIRELETKSDIEIIPPGANIYSGPTFSPDGSYLYYSGKTMDDPETALYQVPAAGGVPRKLLSGNIKHRLRFSPDGKRLAFVVEYRSESAVFVANADGTEERRLATRKDPAFFWSEAWSPDGKRIACAGGNKIGDRSYFDVVEVGIEDGMEKPITSQAWSYIEEITWLSDGSGLLLIASDQGGSSKQIWLLNPDGQSRRITNDLNDYSGLSLSGDSNTLVTTQNGLLMNIWNQPEGAPDRARQITSGFATRDGLSGISWTADGRIVYSSFAGVGPDIWMMDPDGRNQKQLTFDLGSDRFGLSVSPDGRYILFSSFRSGSGDANIWRVDIDGNNPKQLTRGSGVELNPFCSPDSKWVFYNTAGSPIRWKVAIDGGDPVQLTGPYSAILGFSPNGNLTAYLSPDDQGKANRVGIVSVDGESPITVLDQVGHAPRMQWSPDGSAVTYFSSRGGASNIWNLPIDGGPPKQLTDFKPDLDIHCFAWSRDGKQLAVARGRNISDVVLIKDFR